MLAMNNEKNQEQPINFDAIKIGLASPEKIREWSHGEVTKYRCDYMSGMSTMQSL